jgi:hypothetical protein
MAPELGDAGAEPVRLVEERRFTPEPRQVLVAHDGQWWPGFQFAWRLCDDDRGWRADCEWTRRHDWGLGKYRQMLPPARVRLPGAEDADVPTGW